MLRALYVLVLLFVAFGAQAQEKSDQRIAVLELDNPAGLSKQEVNYLSDLMRRLASSELAQSFLVINKANILTLLPPEQTPEDCIGECAVQTGRLLQAAYIITGEIIRFGKQLRVTVKLHDTRSGRLIASEVASGREVTDMEVGIQEAGGRLLRRLMKGADKSSEGRSRRRVISGRRRKLVGSSSAKRVIVNFISKPEGAAVVVDGVQRCEEGESVCKLELTEGAHQVSMTRKDYYTRSGAVNVSQGVDQVEWSLDPSFAILEVHTQPSSLKFTINGEEHKGKYTQRITVQKTYRVVSNDPCFDDNGEEVEAGKPGETIEVNLKPKPLYAMIDVSAKSPKGEPLKAEVIVDGKKLGMTPSQHRVSVCAHSLVVKHGEHSEYKSTLSLSEGETEVISGVTTNTTESIVQKIVDKHYWRWSGTATLIGLGVLVLTGTALSIRNAMGAYENKRNKTELRILGFSGMSLGLYPALFIWLQYYQPKRRFKSKCMDRYRYRCKGKGCFDRRLDEHNPNILCDPKRIEKNAQRSYNLNITPNLAPRNNGMTFGFTATF